MSSSEGLYRTTVCRCLVHRPPYSARLMRFGSRGPSEFFFFSDTPPKCLDRDCAERRCTGNLPYRQRKTGNCCLSAMCSTNSDISACCFKGHDLLKITNINPQGQQQQHHARFSRWKKLDSSRESGENGT